MLMMFAGAIKAQSVTVTTNQDDYWPGQWVTITGTGWQNDDSVQLILKHIDPLPDPIHTHDSWFVKPDSLGNITSEWFVFDQELGTSFELTAVGVNTGYSAVRYFTDAMPSIDKIDPASGPPSGGTPVKITGKNFQDVTSVTFGGFAGTFFSVDKTDNKTIYVTTPAHGQGTVNVILFENSTAKKTLINGFNYECKGDPFVTTQPTSATLTYGADASFGLIADGTDLSYQWEEQPAGGTQWVKKSGATNATLQLSKPTVNMSGNKYHCVATDGCSISVTSNEVTLTVNPKAITVTAVTDSRYYNGTKSSSGIPVIGALATGDVVAANPSQTFDNKNVGTNKILTPAGLAIKDGTGNDMTFNYAISYVTNTTGEIKKVDLNVTAVTDSKVYDGGIASSPAPTIGALVSGDLVNTAPRQTFDNKNFGTAKTLTPAGLTIKDGAGDDMTANYAIIYVVNTTGEIRKYDLNVNAKTDSKVYDGKTTSAPLPTVGTLVSGDLVNAAPTQTFDTKNVGTSKTLTPAGLTIKDGTGSDMTANYSIHYLTNTTGEIKQLGLDVTALADSKTYDGGTGSSKVPAVGSLISGDVINAAPTQTFDNKNAGTAKTLTPAGLTLKDGSGNDMTSNYAISYKVNTSGEIKQLGLDVTALADSKTYDGGIGSSKVPAIGTLISGDVVNATPVQTFDNKNAGTAKTLTPAGLTLKDGSGNNMTTNYAIHYLTNTSGEIKPLGLDVTALADSKTYDGGISSSKVPAVGTLIAGDKINAAPTQTFDNKNVGTAKTLSPVGLTLKDDSGNDVTANYAISYKVNTSGEIKQLGLDVTALADSKTYDGEISSSKEPTVGTLVSGDVVNAAPIQTFDDKNVGTAKTLTPTGLTLKDGDGNDMTANYAIHYLTNTNGEIKQLGLDVTALADSKIYDGGISSGKAPTIGTLILGDVVNAAPTQTFDNKNVGTSKTLTPIGLTLKDSDGNDMTANYAIHYLTNTNGEIKKLGLDVTALADSKTYDGEISSSKEPSVGTLIAGDVVNVAPTQTFDDKNVGTSKTLTPAGLTLKDGSGVDMTANYAINYKVNTLGEIKQLGLDVTAVADSKTYDGGTSSSKLPTVGTLVAGDVVNAAATQTFDNKNVGTAKTLTPAGLTLKDGNGNDMTANYAIHYLTNTSGEIKQMGLDVTALADSKTYDGGISSSKVPTVGTLIAGDMVNASPIQTFDNKNVGTAKTLTPAGLTLKDGNGNDMTANYAIHYLTNTSGEIKQLGLDVTALADSKTYDGGISSSKAPTVGTLIAGDMVNASPIQTFDNKNVGTAKTLTPAGLTLKDGNGNDMTANYAIHYLTNTSGEIKQLGLDVTALADSKTYDGGISSSKVPTVGTLIAGDMVNASPIQTFDNKNVGTAKTLTPAGLILKDSSGSDMTANYAISYKVNSAGEIKQLGLDVTALADSKIYDGGIISAKVPTVGSLVTGDVVNTAPTQTFDNKNVGISKTLTPAGLTIKDASGRDMTANYSINWITNTTGQITPKALVIAATGVDKVYDGNTSATVSLYDNRVSGDVLATNYNAATFSDPLAGPNKPITVSGIAVTGTDAGNYNYNTTTTTTANIGQASTNISLKLSAGAVRYMDQVTLTATIQPLNTGSPLTGKVDFNIGTSTFTANVVPIPGATDGSVQAMIITKLPASIMPSGQAYPVTAKFTSSNPNYLDANDPDQLRVDARNSEPYMATGYYTGDAFAWTTGTNSSTATVTLTAVIKDVNTPKGDVRGAKVSFYYVNGTTLTPIPSAQNLPVGLIDVSDGSVGAASAIVQLNIGSSNAASFQIAVKVSGAYTNNPADALSQTFVTVSKPIAGGYISGGSQLINSNSMGYIKGATGLPTNYEFDIQYTKSGTNPKGKANIKIISYYDRNGLLDSKLHTYLITTNAIALLNVVGTAPATGTFSAKANLTEQLDDFSSVGIEGGATFQMTAYQNKCDQQIAITLYRKAGGIWFSSNWDNIKAATILQAVQTGSCVYVAGGGACSASAPAYKSAEIGDQVQPTEAPKTVDVTSLVSEVKKVVPTSLEVFPNPSKGPVTFKFRVKQDSKVVIDLLSASGSLISHVFSGNIAAGQVQTVLFNKELQVGVYFYRMITSDGQITGKLIRNY